MPAVALSLETEVAGGGIVRFGHDDHFHGVDVDHWTEPAPDTITIPPPREDDEPRCSVVIKLSRPTELEDEAATMLVSIAAHTRRVTVSAGATLQLPTETLDDAIGRADTALYRAKSEGRNCVRFA